MLARAPTVKQLMQCLFCASLCHFLFGHRVTEMESLAPNLMFALLLADLGDYLALFTFVTSFSMWPLYRKDENKLNYLLI